MVELIINIVLIVSSTTLAIVSIIKQIQDKQLPKKLLIITFILLVISFIYSPISEIKNYFTIEKLKNTRVDLESKLDSANQKVNDFVYTIHSIELEVGVLVIPLPSYNTDSWYFNVRRVVNMEDTAGQKVSLFTDYNNWTLPKRGEKVEFRDYYTPTKVNQIIGKPFGYLKKFDALRILPTDFISGNIEDTIGVRYSIVVNGITIVEYPLYVEDNNKVAYKKLKIENITDTLRFILFMNERNIDSVYTAKLSENGIEG